VPVSPETSEALTNFLWELGALGVVEEETPGTPARLRAFFPAAAAVALGARVDAYAASLAALGLDGAGPAAVAPLDDADWAAAWREHFHPVAVGRRLLVAPPWAPAAADGRLVVTIEPARAFGTGHHGSTAGCLALLERLLDARPVAAMLDLGAGSGILAIAAARLGVAAVLAVDSDPDAVAATAANAALNGVADRVRAELADAATLRAAPAPLVTANLLAAAHTALADRYATLVAPGGALVLGGCLDAEAEAVAAALARRGFGRADAVSLDGWTSLALRHAAVHARA
jgi:ribosomal protein L11 methyltransferase